MCEYCEKITLVPNFKSPKDYEKTMTYIGEIIKNRLFACRWHLPRRWL